VLGMMCAGHGHWCTYLLDGEGSWRRHYVKARINREAEEWTNEFLCCS
jgi:hypothetical protein